MEKVPRPLPFSAFEWLLSGRYLRARRKEGFISVIAGFSFLGIVLGVATLIIVMAVMNGFRKELIDKIVGMNGHLVLQPIESPLTDWQDVTERIRQRRPRGCSFAALAPMISTSSPRSPAIFSRVRWKHSSRGRASPSAAAWPNNCRCVPATRSRWLRPAKT